MEENKKAARPGRRPMTQEEKDAARRKSEEAKAKALAMKPAVYVQYQESEAEVEALIEAAKADFKTKKKRTLITSLKLYIKPEERAAYYVVNDNDSEDFSGRISY